MSLLTPYLAAHGVSVTWKHKTGNDGDDDIFTSSTITVLWAFGSRVIRTIRGDEIQCQALCRCEADVEAGDVITFESRDYPVLGLVGVAYDGSMRALALGTART